ncbi:hypothetical protein BH09BAC1_BH09BAC1_21310 [soil metagenome]
MKKLLFCLMLALAATVNVQSQTAPPDVPNDPVIIEENANGDNVEVFRIVEVMPKFPGGEGPMMKYLSSFQYPPEASKNKQQGTTYINIVITEDGSISNVAVARSSGHEILDKAAMEHIAAMPKWKPGTQAGKPVRVQYTIPIKFKL